MITRPETLVEIAETARITVPTNLKDYDRSEYPYWYLFCQVQIDRPMPKEGSALVNACVVASIDPEDIRDTTFADIADLLE